MSETAYLTANTLLTYGVTTNPSPLEVSPDFGDSSVASLTITTTSNGAVYVESIVFSFDVGDGAEFLTDVASGILCAASPSNAWQIAYEDNGDQAVFIATPTAGGAVEINGQGPTFTIYDIQVSKVMGAAVFTVTETSSATNANFAPSTTEILLTKAPQNFLVRDFATQTPYVNWGETALLSWLGSQDTQTVYTMLWDDTSQVVTGDRDWQTPALYETTMFVLRVDTQLFGETVTKYLSLTVVVSLPSISAHDLAVTNNTLLAGNLTTAGSIQASGLTVSNNASIDGTATVASLTVSGSTNLNSTTTVNAALTVTSSLSCYTNITLLTLVSTPVAAVTLYYAGSFPNYYGKADVKGANGTLNVSLTANAGNNNMGEVDLCDQNGNVRAKAVVNTDGTGGVYIYNSSGAEAGELSVDNHGNGHLIIKDNTGNDNDIQLYVDDTHGYSVISTGSAYIYSSGSKHFRLPNPQQPDTDIWYACVEGPEAAAYMRGTAWLVEGRARVELPAHFEAVSGSKLTTIMLTPLSADSLGLAVVKKGTTSFEVRELHRGSGTYEFDWEIKCVRRDMEDYQVIRPHRKRPI